MIAAVRTCAAGSGLVLVISRGSELILVCPCICLRSSVRGNADKKLSELTPPPRSQKMIMIFVKGESDSTSPCKTVLTGLKVPHAPV